MASMQGLPEAQHNLGECYRTGFGLAEDQVEAYAFWNLAGASYERSRADLAILERGMSPEARARGQQRTKELQKEIADKQAAK
jgi:TPR repeat protein